VFDAEAMIRSLNAHRVEFVVVGGMAMVTQGSAHVTSDLDICYGRTDENLASLARALAPYDPTLRGAPPGLPFRFDALTLRAGLNFTLATDIGFIDLLGELTGIGDFERVVKLSEEVLVYGLAVRVLSVEGLIVAKRAAGRPKDMLHIEELLEIRRLRDAGSEDHHAT